MIKVVMAQDQRLHVLNVDVAFLQDVKNVPLHSKARHVVAQQISNMRCSVLPVDFAAQVEQQFLAGLMVFDVERISWHVQPVVAFDLRFNQI